MIRVHQTDLTLKHIQLQSKLICSLPSYEHLGLQNTSQNIGYQNPQAARKNCKEVEDKMTVF